MPTETIRGDDQALLEVRGLSTSFTAGPAPIRAVDGVSFTLRAGEVLGLVGESGSGKTILSRTIMGLIPRHGMRCEGAVMFEGRNLLAATETEMQAVLGAEIAMVFQDPMTSLNPVMKIGAQVAEPLRLHQGLSRRESRERVLELLASVHMSEPRRRVDQFPHELSGGMRQRIMIAIAIACNPKLLLADEPTTALDVTVQAQILDLLAEKQAEHGMAMILVSHDFDVVADHTDRIAVMYAGQIIETGPTKPLMAGMRTPYAQGLLDAVPRLDAVDRKRLPAIPGRPPDLGALLPGCRFAPRCERVTDRCRAAEPGLEPSEIAAHQFACWHPLDPPTLRRPGIDDRSADMAAASRDRT